MCNPSLAIAAISAGVQYQQSVNAQKDARNLQIQQNIIAARDLDNRRANQQAKLIQQTTANLEKAGKAEKEFRRRRASFQAQDTGFTGNTYDTLLANYYDNEGGYRNAILGNIEQDVQQYKRDYKTANLIYESRTSYVTPVDRNFSALSAGLKFGGAYYDYKYKEEIKGAMNKRYGYEEKQFGNQPIRPELSDTF